VGWVIGIDEAGYGPNLGPFVMTAVACRVPPGREDADLWLALRGATRRAGEAVDGRLLVADSKVVYAGPRGLRALERGVLAVPWEGPAGLPATLADLVERSCAADRDELHAEPWFRGTHPLPAELAAEDHATDAGQFSHTCAEAGVSDWRVYAAVVCPPRFNALTEQADSKGAVLAHAMARLLRRGRELPGDEMTSVVVDKHGGRNSYAPFIQDALQDGAVMAREEGAARSVYEVLGLDRPMRLTFRPRAEEACFCVALASMASKYLRELLMREFNRFWQEHVPGLKPTAGYPGDSTRFLEAIRPAAQRLGIAEASLWRYR
jgi:ribonuclease HII